MIVQRPRRSSRKNGLKTCTIQTYRKWLFSEGQADFLKKNKD